MSTEAPTAHLASLNVGRTTTVEWQGRKVRTAIWKRPVDHAVAVGHEQLDGDQQSDLRVHGGPDKAVYVYAAEDYEWWRTQPDLPTGAADGLPPGSFGENLTTVGIDVTNAVIGELWTIGDATFAVAQPRFACFKLGIRMAASSFSERFDDALRPGLYLRVAKPGTIEPAQPVAVHDRPEHGLTIRDVANAFTNHDEAHLRAMLDVDDLPADLVGAARRTLGRLGRDRA